jgi:hypothetical protein
MHSVGVMTQEERIAGDGTLHLMSISRRKKGTEPTYKDLMDLFHQKPLEPLETVRETEDDEYEEVVLDSVEGGSLTAAIFGIVKGTVGPAVLYLPRGFALSGYAVAIPAMIIATISYLYSATRLLQCWKVESDKNRALAQKMEELRGLLDPEGAEIESKKQYGSTPADLHCAPLENAGHLLTYPELARRAFGKASVLISGGIAAMQFGVCHTAQASSIHPVTRLLWRLCRSSEAQRTLQVGWYSPLHSSGLRKIMRCSCGPLRASSERQQRPRPTSQAVTLRTFA